MTKSSASNVAEPLIQAGLLGEAIDGAPVAVFVADENGTYVAVNRYACDLLGYEREQLLALGPRDVAASPDVEAGFEQLRRTGSLVGTVDLCCKDGGTVTVAYRTAETKAAGMAFYVSVAWPA